jgi:Flp pilus assembly protein TadG
MLQPLIQRPHRRASHRSRERGVTMALVALAMVGIIAMAALSIDVGALYQASAEAQRAADAAALAGAKVLSLSGMTGDPTNSSILWAAACASAMQTAQTVANQNNVGGKAPSTVTVTFLSSDTSNCSSGTGNFGINPMVKVQVVQASLPTYFSRIWGRSGSSVSATATAEVYNPSNSASIPPSDSVVPVQPRCVKPLIIPNVDPGNPAPGCTGGCLPFVNRSTGAIQNPGIQVMGGGGTGVIGETFELVPDCNTNGPTCNLTPGGGLAYTSTPAVPVGGKLQYLPGVTPSASTAVPSCAAGAFQQALAGCDQTTQYQCGVLSTATSNALVDLNENPGAYSNDTSVGAQCLIRQAGAGGTGQDTLTQTVYPYQIIAGARNPLGVSGSAVTSSTSIVSIPIYDNTAALVPNGSNQVPVTIVGFLQVFINDVAAGGINGSLNVTVLNVAGCGNGVPSGTTPLYGTSPVPVRLITPP